MHPTPEGQDGGGGGIPPLPDYRLERPALPPHEHARAVMAAAAWSD